MNNKYKSINFVNCMYYYLQLFNEYDLRQVYFAFIEKLKISFFDTMVRL